MSKSIYSSEASVVTVENEGFLSSCRTDVFSEVVELSYNVIGGLSMVVKRVDLSIKPAAVFSSYTIGVTDFIAFMSESFTAFLGNRVLMVVSLGISFVAGSSGSALAPKFCREAEIAVASCTAVRIAFIWFVVNGY